MRISRHQMFMDFAIAASKRSTCGRLAVGAVIVIGNNPVAIGYNGPPAGEAHCNHNDCAVGIMCSRSIHAEHNAILKLHADFLGDPSKVMYTTDSPCMRCADEIKLWHFKELYYMHEYRIPDGINLIKSAGVKVFRMTSSGYLVTPEGEVIEQNT